MYVPYVWSCDSEDNFQVKNSCFLSMKQDYKMRLTCRAYFIITFSCCNEFVHLFLCNEIRLEENCHMVHVVRECLCVHEGWPNGTREYWANEVSTGGLHVTVRTAPTGWYCIWWKYWICTKKINDKLLINYANSFLPIRLALSLFRRQRP